MAKKNSNIQTYRVLTGMTVIYLGVAIAVGDLVSAGTLVLASIICTAGLSLIVWFPCSWLVGFLVLYLINSLKRKSFVPPSEIVVQSTSVEAEPTAVLSNDILAIAQYIKKSRNKGASDSQITNRLKWTGWTEKDIKMAFTYLASTPIT
ncbi:hypothetical protein [[Limnothrix rosea] IAM M-220]|uniref:hypothetical protein n=1 Tax=[Limnothrix rosea] IAM M-220 TaxID=454133 RepID=UPI000960C910|nr:hypothetical protein [[Limnothrix rosea] IAM M-220]OKH12522.1 hypothetical protein NIES208_15990 [[Limnothrix rosea] IAM M-220]